MTDRQDAGVARDVNDERYLRPEKFDRPDDGHRPDSCVSRTRGDDRELFRPK